MEPTIIGSWSKRTARPVPRSSSDEGTRPQKRSKKHRGTPEPSSGVEEGEYDKKYTSDLLSIRDAVEELQSNERSFHRSQQAQYEGLKRTIVDMESRWTREQYKRQMANAKQQQRILEEVILRQNEQASDDLMSSARQDAVVVVRKALTPAVTPVHRAVVSGLPTPGETVRRLSMERPSPSVLGQRPGEDLMMELFGLDPPIRRFKSEDDSDIPMFTTQWKGKQPARYSPMVPRPQSPQRCDTKRLRALSAVIDINTSDGDDEDDIGDGTASLQAEQTTSTSDCGGIIWPAGVGIGPESDEIDMKDEHLSAADIPFPELEQVLSPSTVCADHIVPVCREPFKASPSYRLGSPILGHDCFVWKPVDYSVRGDPGSSVDGMGQGVDQGIKKSSSSTAAATTPTTATAVAGGGGTSGSSPAGAVRKAKKSTKLFLEKTSVVPRPRIPPAPDAPKKQERDPQRLIHNGRLIPISDDSDSDVDMDMNVNVPARFQAQPPPQLSALSTRGSIHALGIPPLAPNISEPMLRFSRTHIHKAFGGKPSGTVTIVKANAGRIFPVEQFLCINENLNPYYPSHAGAHGAMFIFRTGTVPLNTEWAVFCSRRRIGTGPQETFEYAGNYIVRDVNDVPYEEWMDSSAKFKEGWAGHVAHQAKSPKGWASQNLASRGLVRSADGVTPEQIRGWFDAAAPGPLERHSYARLGRRVLEFKEFKSGVYNALVKVKNQNG